MSTIILDTNILVALLTQEENSEEVQEMYTSIVRKQYSIAAPSFMPIEFLSVVRKKCMYKDLSEKQADTVREIFSELQIKTVEADNNLLNKAYHIATQLKLPTIYDSLFVATAMEQSAPFISADTRFTKMVRDMYPPTHSLKDWRRCGL